MVKELQDIASDIYRFTSCSQIQLDINWIPHDPNSHVHFFFSKIVDFDDCFVIDEVFVHLEELWGSHSVLLAVTTLNCPGLIPDSFSQD